MSSGRPLSQGGWSWPYWANHKNAILLGRDGPAMEFWPVRYEEKSGEGPSLASKMRLKVRMFPFSTFRHYCVRMWCFAQLQPSCDHEEKDHLSKGNRAEQTETWWLGVMMEWIDQMFCGMIHFSWLSHFELCALLITVMCNLSLYILLR